MLVSRRWKRLRAGGSLFFAFAPLFCAAAQTSAARLEFEAASVKPATFGPAANGLCRGGPGNGDPGLFTCSYVDLKRIIVRAFRIRPFQLVAPDWTQDQRFDIRAAVAPGTTQEQFGTMLQNLLVDRFHLAFHREPREATRYELLIAEGGPKLKEVEETEAPAEPAAPNSARPDRTALKKIPLDRDGYPTQRTGLSVVNGRARFYQPYETIPSLLFMLEMITDKPVMDATGLKGVYEIDLHWGQAPLYGQLAAAQANAAIPPTGPPAASDAGPGGPTIQQALRAQLGLKLELKKGPVEMLVIDRVDRVPTEN